MSKTTITRTQLILSILFNGGNTLIFIILLKTLYLDPGILKYLTYLSFCANSIFLFFCLLCDIFIYLSNNNSNEINNDYVLIQEENKEEDNTWFEKLNDWNRNKYSLICNPFSFFVTFSFWILYFLGESYIRVSSGFTSMTRTIYFHLIITILVIMDIFISRRKYISKKDKYSNLVIIIFIIYCILICIMKYCFNIMPYAFLKSGLLFLICFIVISFVLLNICYKINIWLVNYANDDRIYFDI